MVKTPCKREYTGITGDPNWVLGPAVDEEVLTMADMSSGS